MRVQDVMSKKVISIAPATPVAMARVKLQNAGIDHLVVIDGTRVVGVVAGKDIVNAFDGRPVADVMSGQVATITPTATLRRAAGMMRGRAIGCLPVVDEGKLVGIVTTSDLLTALAKGETHASPPRERPPLSDAMRRKRAAPHRTGGTS